MLVSYNYYAKVEKFSRSTCGGETVDFNTHIPLENISAPRYDL